MVDGVGGRANVDLFALDQHVAVRRPRIGAEDGGDKFGSPSAHQSGDAEDFAAIGRERRFPDPFFARQIGMVDLDIPDLEDFFAAFALAPRKHVLDVAADHSGDDLVEGDVGDRRDVADGLPVPQHHDPIGDLLDLLHFVGNVAHADAVLLQLADDPEEVRHFPVGQRRGRFVEDENARALRQRLGDFDHLLLADGDVLDLIGGFEVPDAEFVKQGLGVGIQPAPIDCAQAVGRLTVKEDVLGDGELGNEIQFLIDDRDARLLGFAGVVEIAFFRP